MLSPLGMGLKLTIVHKKDKYIYGDIIQMCENFLLIEFAKQEFAKWERCVQDNVANFPPHLLIKKRLKRFLFVSTIFLAVVECAYSIHC